MKKLLHIILAAVLFILLSLNVNAQSQRLVFSEEFTQASCGPCAAANPAFNTLLGNNVGKITAIKYQASWPGTDPMNTQNPTQVATRVSYYGITSVPIAVMDGAFPPIVVSGSYSGYPGNITQSTINTEYGVPSPFTMNLSHTLSSDGDSIFITCVITCTQALSVTGPLKCHVAITENEIHFTTAPGTNGEKDFYNVMRKMLPSDQGTTLATSWTVGQTQTISFAVPLPTYIYDNSKIAVVAWIQDNSNKNVKQAAFSAPLPMALDAGVTAISNVPFMQCSATFTPHISLKNFGATTLTSATINYKIDNGTPSTQAWTGSLAFGNSVQITLPLITATQGSHTFTASVSSPNGGTDQNSNNNSNTSPFAISLNTASVPLAEGFTGNTFPPANWILYNLDAGATWSRKTGAGGFGSSTSCAKMDFYNSASGNIDDLIIAPVNLSSATVIGMNFNVAYARFSATLFDRLQVQVSTNCGTTWTTVWDKQSTTLATAPDNGTSSFTPTSSQWRAETIDLSSYAGQASVFIKFHAISGYGNCCYVDDINITGVVSVPESINVDNNLNVYPNPFSNSTNVEFTLTQPEKVSASVYNLIGEKVLSVEESSLNAGTHQINVNGNNMTQGVYYLNINIGNSTYTKKLIVVK
jgi:hypothetical protein